MEGASKQDELNEIMKKNEELLNYQKQCDEKIKALEKENESKKEEIKTKNNNQELFDLIVAELKDYLKSKEQTEEIAQQKKKLQDDINNAYYKAQQATHNYDELEKYNSDILKKIKEINDEKAKIEERLKQNYEETKNQCNKFKEEYQKKYDEISNEAIIKENEDLKVRIKECEENTNKIKKNIDEQMEMRKKQTDDITNMLNGQISDKLSEINKETGKFDEENEKLKLDIKIEKAKYGDDQDIMKKFNKKFDKAKKEYEKIFRDLVQLSQENRKLKEIDPVSIRKEIDKNKEKLNELVKSNKELQAKIKEYKNKPKEPSTSDKKEENVKKEEEPKKEDKKEEDKKEDKKEEDKKEDKKEEKKEDKKEEIKEDKKEEKKEEEAKKEENTINEEPKKE
jgi:hypothetical protein